VKTRNKIMFGAVLVAPLFIFSTVSAQNVDQTTGNARKQVAQTSTETKPQLTTEEKTALQERISKRKAELKVRISNAEKQRLQTRCKNSTGQISSLSGRIKGIETSRTEVYENLVSRLTKLSDRLQDRAIDTTEFDAEIVQLQEKIVTFQTDLAGYKQTVSDLDALGADCATDAEGFKASLEVARSAREKLKVDVNDIKSFVNDTIKPTLKTIREAIVKEDGEAESDSGSNTDDQETGEEPARNETTTNEGN
jgi:chromosome segregation ATPase